MNKTAAAVCAAVLVLILQSEKCFSLETSRNVKNAQIDEKPSKLSTQDFVRFLSIRHKINDGKDSLEKTASPSKRVVRQAYQGQTPLYPIIPSGPPYGQDPYPNYNNQNNRPGYNNPSVPYGQNTQPNAWQPNGQPNYNNQYGTNNYTQPGTHNSNAYKPSNSTNIPTGTYGQYPQQPQPNQWQPNGQQPNYNNPYGTNTQSGHNNFTQPGYPISNGYKPSNFSHNPSGPYGQSTPPNTWQNPYSSNMGQRPYNSNVSNPYPGFKPANTYNNPSGRPPYNQPGQSQNNPYSGYPSHTTTPRPYPGYPGQSPQYYPGQSQNNSTRPGNQHSVIYDDSTKRPGQNPYNSYNASNWSGSTSTTSTSPYNSQNQRPPYQNPNYGQHASNNYPGYSSDSATFNLSNSGYNPSIPVRPPNGSPYGNGPYGNSSPNQFQYPNGNVHDPTKVSPQHFNSY